MLKFKSNIQYSKGENFPLEDNDGNITIDFDCGPVDENDMFIDDTGNFYKQLSTVMESNGLNVEIGTAECYHILTVPDGITPDEAWSKLSTALENAGAVAND